MVHGMEKEQFLKFRMSLLPASGFQSAQYRLIEICTTDINNLTQKDIRESVKGKSINDQAQHFLLDGRIERIETGKKTQMLENFVKKYMQQFIQTAEAYKSKNLLAKYQSLTIEEQQNEALISELRQC